MRQSKILVTVVLTTLAIAGCTTQETKNQEPQQGVYELEAKEVIGSILFDQKTYFLENNKFTTSFNDLRTATVKTDAPDYTYHLKAKPDKKRGVAVTAVPKKANLKSFTGVVFIVNSDKTSTTVSEICETVSPSKKAPSIPALPKQAKDQILCPAGSRSSFAVLAQQ